MNDVRRSACGATLCLATYRCNSRASAKEGHCIYFLHVWALDLLPDSFDQVIDPEQAELYARTRNQLVQLKEEIPSQERAQVNLVIDDFLDQPANWSDVKFKKILWLCGNSLRNALAQHDAVKDDFDPHYRKLPRIVAETLRKPVETWNIVALGDQTLRDLDAQRIGPHERQF